MKNATNAMVQGSFDEDFKANVDPVGGYRSLNHFYDPTKNPPIGLTDKPWPLLSGPMGRDSFYWGSVSNATDIGATILAIPFNRGTSNIWSWPNARGYEWLGLTATNQSDRLTNLENMFRAVGQVMHLLEDTSQPQHVCNEQHWDQLLNMDLRSRSAIEDYGSKHVACLNYAHGMLDWRGAGFTQLKDFWDRDKLRTEGATALNADLSGGADTLGLAEFCNGNFIGQRAVYGEFFPDHSDRHYFQFPSLANTTQPNLKDGHLWETAQHGDVTLESFKQGTRLYISKNPGAGVPVTYHSALSYFIAQHPGRSIGMPILTIADDNVLSNYHNIFIPKAVEYSADVLDYFFRGTMSASISLDTNTDLYTITNLNTSGQDFHNGVFYLFQETNGIRTLIQSNAWSGTLANSNSMTMTFYGPLPSGVKLFSIYQGTIGWANSDALDPVDKNIGIAVGQAWVEQTKTYDNYLYLAGYGTPDSGIPPGGTLATNLQSDDFGFTPTPGYFEVVINGGEFDDTGTIGGVTTTVLTPPCGWPATFANTPIIIPASAVSVVGNRLQVDISATDDCISQIGWQNVSITWCAIPVPP